MVLLCDKVLVSDVRNYIQGSKHCKDDDLNFLEQELHNHLKCLDFIQIEIVLIKDGKHELLSNWLSEDPANPKANNIDWVTLIFWTFLHAFGEELLIDINC